MKYMLRTNKQQPFSWFYSASEYCKCVCGPDAQKSAENCGGLEWGVTDPRPRIKTFGG